MNTYLTIIIKIDKIEPKQVTKLETNATTLVVSISYRRIIPTLKNNSKPNWPLNFSMIIDTVILDKTLDGRYINRINGYHSSPLFPRVGKL